MHVFETCAATPYQVSLVATNTSGKTIDCIDFGFTFILPAGDITEEDI